MSITLTLTEIIGLAGVSLSFAVAFATVLWTLWRMVQRNAENLSIFKLEVARSYASYQQISEIERKLAVSEERLVQSMTNLTNRIDRMLDRIEKGR